MLILILSIKKHLQFSRNQKDGFALFIPVIFQIEKYSPSKDESMCAR